MRAAASILVLLLLGLGLIPGPTRTPSYGATAELRAGVSRLPASLDPATTRTGPEVLVMRHLFEGLVEFGDRGEVVPALATQWSVSRDGLVWTFRLRRDVQFSNGSPLTADVVVAALMRHFGPADPGIREPTLAKTKLLRDRLVQEVRRTDPATVQIRLRQPFSPILAALAHPALAIVLPQNDADVPFLGTGPYRIAERSPGRLVLEASPTARGEPSWARRLVLQEMPDDAAGVAELGPRGLLDVYFPRAGGFGAAPGLQVVTAPSWQVGLLAFRSDEGLFARKVLRQAVGLALDPGLVQPAFAPGALPIRSYLPPGAWAAREIALPAHEPARARRLVAEARVAKSQLTLLHPEPPPGQDTPRLAEAIRLSLAVAGLALELRAEPGDGVLRAIRQGDWDLALIEATLEVNDPHFALQPLVASEAVVAGDGSNVARYRSGLVDSMLLRASQLGFRPERLRLYHRIQAHLADELPYIPLYVRLQSAVARPGVRELRLDPTGRHDLARVWVDPQVEPPAGPPSGLPVTQPPAVPAPPPPAFSPPGGSSP